MPKIYRSVIANICYLEELEVDQETYDRLSDYKTKEREFWSKDFKARCASKEECEWLEDEPEEFNNSLYDKKWDLKFPSKMVDREEETQDIGEWGIDKEWSL